jgi:sigma-E factor negative regulatory protein RseC
MNYPADGEMHEEGVVTALVRDQAVVKTVQQDACHHCSVKGACQAMGGGKERQVTALNQAGAMVGDRVALGIGSGSALSAGFLAYLVPVLALLAGAAAGKSWGPFWGLSDQSAAVVTGLAALAVAWVVVRWLSDRLARRGRFMVKVVAVVQKGEADAVEQNISCL